MGSVGSQVSQRNHQLGVLGVVRRVLRVAEPVAYGDDALHVPDGVDDAEADPGGFRRALRW